MSIRRILPLLTAVLVTVTGACGSVSPPYAAIVNGHRVSAAAITNELRTIRANRKYTQLVESRGFKVEGSGKGTFDSAYTAQVLTRRIFYELIGEELQRRNIRLNPGGLSAARSDTVAELGGEDVLAAFPKPYQATLVRRRAQFAALAVALGSESGAGDARAYYNAHPQDFEQACVLAILVDSKDKADKLEARLAKGEDFATVAKAESSDAESAPKGGDLGCSITRSTRADPAFVNAVFSQPVGQVGPPVQTSQGFDIVKVVSRTTPPFEQVAAQAEDRVASAGQEKLVSFILDAVGKAKIKVNPTFGRFDPTPPRPRVVPPEEPATAPEGLPQTPSSVPTQQP